ncbi:hypothetical protein FOZ63_023865, partial [Perkinsus olseni]
MVNLDYWALPWMTIVTAGMTVQAASKGSGGRRRPSRDPVHQAECASLDRTDTLTEQITKLTSGLTKLTEKVSKMSEKFSKLSDRVASLTEQVSVLHDERKQSVGAGAEPLPGEKAKLSHNMPERQSSARQTKSPAQHDTSSARMSELYNENRWLSEEVNKLNSRMSGLLSFNEQ